ncbi:hypothetical protein ACOSQ2_014213 [Xanthoceras sorbifolium]
MHENNPDIDHSETLEQFIRSHDYSLTISKGLSCSNGLHDRAPSITQQVTGEPLIQRKDDTAAVLKSRLEAFHRQTESFEDV